MARAFTIAVGLASSFVLAARTAHADEARVRFAVIPAGIGDECIRRDEVTHDVTTRLGRDPFDPAALRSIEVVLSRDGTSYTARIFAREEPASQPALRVLTGDDCSRLRTALSLAVALAIDPNAPLAPIASSSPPPPASEPPPPSPSPPASSAPPPAPIRAEDPGAWDRTERLAIRGGAVIGTTPAPAPYVELGFDTARRGLFRGRFGALRTFETLTDDASFGFTLTAFSAAFCIGAAQSRFAINACAGARAGIVTGVVHRLTGLTPRDPGDYGWVALHLDAAASLRIVDPVVLEIGAQPFVTVLRQVFAVARGGTNETVYEQSPVGVFVYAGVRIRFW